MGSHTVEAKPSVRSMKYQGVCISRNVILCKSVEMALQTKQSICINIGGRISGVSVWQGFTVTSSRLVACLQFVINTRLQKVQTTNSSCWPCPLTDALVYKPSCTTVAVLICRK